MGKSWMLLLLVLSCSVPMVGQGDKGGGELFGGYSFERIGPGCGTDYRCATSSPGPTADLNGWTAAVTGYFSKSVGITAAFAGSYNGRAALSYSTITRYTYQFGPTYSFHMGKANPFVHALFGGVSQKSSADPTLTYHTFLLSLGGGVDFKASSHLFIRAAQVDYERQTVPVYVAPSVSANGMRYSAGIVFKF